MAKEEKPADPKPADKPSEAQGMKELAKQTDKTAQAARDSEEARGGTVVDSAGGKMMMDDDDDESEEHASVTSSEPARLRPTSHVTGEPLMTREEAAALPKGPASADPKSPGYPSGPANMPAGDPRGRPGPHQVDEAGNRIPDRERPRSAADEVVMNHPDLQEADGHFSAALAKAHGPHTASAMGASVCEVWAQISPDVERGVAALADAVRLPLLARLAPVVGVMQLLDRMMDAACQGDDPTSAKP